MNDFQKTNSIATGAVGYCTNCTVAEVTNPPALCDDCRRATEVDSLLENAGVTREEIECKDVTPSAVIEPLDDDIPIRTNGSAKPTPQVIAEPVHEFKSEYKDPGPNWVEELGEAYKIAREGADEASPEFVDFPTALIKSVVKENNHITKRDVESVLAEFTMNVSLGQYHDEAMALVVTDINDKQGMKKARELRLVGKRERVRFDQQGIEIKEPLLRRTQLIDGMRRAVRMKFEVCEKHLLEQEEFEKREIERIAAELQTVRIEELAAFEWLAGGTDTDRAGAATELRLGYLSDAEWNLFKLQIETAYNEKKEAERIAEEERKAEEERLERENARLQKVNERVAEMTKLGLNYDGELFTCSDIAIALADIEFATDEKFARLMTKLAPQVEAIKDAEFAADQERLRLKTEAEAERRKKEAAEAELKRQADEKAAEEKRLADEAEAKRLAPDKDKLLDFADRIALLAGESPNIDSKFAPLLGEIEHGLLDLAKQIRESIDKF